MKKINTFTLEPNQSYTLADLPDTHKDFAADCSHQGSCDEDVEYWTKYFECKEPDFLKRYLKKFGAWDKDELENHEDNMSRLIWLAACDIKEQGEFIFGE
jgi:hypothetical protein